MNKPDFALLPKGIIGGKVFSHFPTNGNGDLDFVRASEATRRGKEFLETVAIDTPRINEYYFDREYYTNEYPFTSNRDRYTEEGDAIFLEPSEDEAIFSKLNSKVFKIQYSGGSFNNRVAINNISPQSSTMALTFYVKPISATAFSFRIRKTDGTVDQRISFNFDTDTRSDDGTAVSDISVVKAEEGFYKVSGTFTGFNTSDDIQYRISSNGQGGANQVILITGISINGEFQERNSVSNYYDLRKKGNSLLLEGSSFNGIADGNKVGDGSWFNESSRFTVNLDEEMSPFGLKEATLVKRNSELNATLFYNVTKPAEQQTRVVSIFAKPKINARYLRFSSESSGATQHAFAVFDTETGQPVVTSQVGAFKLSYAGSQDYGNGWRRYYIASQTDSSTTATLRVSFCQELFNYYTWQSDIGEIYGEMYLFGAQSEVSRNLSSYIRTSGTALTRQGETCYGGNFDINGSELTCYYVFKDNGQSGVDVRASISDDTTNNRISFVSLADEKVGFQKVIGGVEEYFRTFETSNYKKQSYSVTNKSDQYNIYINGELVSQDSSGVEEFPIGDLSSFGFDNGGGGAPLKGDIFTVLIFDRVLTQNEIKELDKIFL